MSEELPQPSDEQKKATALILGDIIKLLKIGLFQGENSEAVTKAIWWLKNCSNGMTVQEPADVKE